ncbi:MAG: lipoprotein-releasing system ATP-binding protein [Candidatus Azotimanducaceae bacterium]|jgi:lipoprotein-releasing system ATP-binding protein
MSSVTTNLQSSQASEAAETDIVLAVSDLHKTYYQGAGALHILRGVNLDVRRGERLAIVGLSGSGKSTLLHLLGGLDSADQGSVSLKGVDLAQASEPVLCQLRNQQLGFVYQFHHLMADFSAAENVAMPLLIGGAGRRQALQSAAAMLDLVGLSRRLSHRPSELSGGERQRVALARALVTTPDCVLADEPTGNLDEKTAADVNDLMVTLSHELHISFIVVTHNLGLAQRMDSVYRLHDGQLARDEHA